MYLWIDKYEQKAWVLTQCKKSGRKDEKLMALINDRASLFIYCCLIRNLPSVKNKLGSDLLYLLHLCSKISWKKIQKWRLESIIKDIVSQLDKTNCYIYYRMTIVPKDKNVYYDILKILEKLSKF